MPCYFFRIKNGKRISAAEGEHFPDDQVALKEAALIAQDLSKNQISPTSLRVIVTNETSDKIGEVPS